MVSAMQCYQDLTPSTAVTASIAIPFLSGSTSNLIVAKTNLLQVFALKSVLSSNSASRKTFGIDQAKGSLRLHTSKLVLISEHEVCGTITGLAKIKTTRSKSGGDLLLVAIKDAKLSLVEWDPERHSISTLSIHYYEREDLQVPPWAPDLSDCKSILTVDPSNRCIALKFGPRSLAILPLKQAGDDLAMEDAENLADQLKRTTSRTNGDGLEPSQSTPYSASFVLSLLQLDPVLIHPIHLSFLYEYRDPTIGILSSKQATSSALLHERMDIVSYTVYTLDLEQQASTPLLSITGLPYDMHSVLPLPLPIGGALLIGNNVLVHVGQAGKTNAIAVNPLAQVASNYPMVAHTDLNLRLEGCVIEPLGGSNGELLIITSSCEMVVLSFKLDGRSVSGISIKKVEEHAGGSILSAPPSCATGIGNGRLFIGSCDGNSTLIGWSSKNARSRAVKKESIEEHSRDIEDDGLALDDEFEDDLYGNGESKDKSNASQISAGDILEDIEFRRHDELTNLAPLNHVTMEQSSLSNPLDEDDKSWNRLDLLGVSGRGKTSSLVRLNRTICPAVTRRYDIAGVAKVWAFHLESSIDELAVANNDHNVVIATMDPELSEGGSAIFRISKEGIAPLESGDFESEAGPTLEVGTLFGGVRVVQVLKSEVRAFDGDLALAQIIPITEEGETIAASFADPFVLLNKSDGSIAVLMADESAELEELEVGSVIADQKWRSGCLYDDVADTFRLVREATDEDSPTSMLLFLLSDDGGLFVFCMPNLNRPVYHAPGLSFLPPFLTPDFTVRRSNARDDLVELLVAHLGDSSHSSPHLILRSRGDDLTIYSPYHAVRESISTNALQFRKIKVDRIPHALEDGPSDSESEKSRSPLRSLLDIDGINMVFMPGRSPCFIMKAASCTPKIIDAQADQLNAITKVELEGYPATVLFPGSFGRLTMATLPTGSDFTTGWLVEKMYTTDPIQAFAFHEPSGRYVIGTNRKVPFKLPQDDFHPEWESETTDFLPMLEVGALELVDPTTWSVTDRFPMKEDEIIVDVKKMSLELSENTHARKSVIGVATAGIRGEDINAYGTIYVLDVIDVVPVPDQPETGRKFKTLAHHRDKGAVTAICQVGSEGFLLGAQGQKCMVRGVKDDASLLPVAFMDTQCYISVAKELRGAGLCLLGDAIKGLWLAGYTEDPYHLKMFGKSAHDIEVVNAEFLPDGKALYIVLSDAQSHIHVLRFDPQNPKSLSGQHLLQLSSFKSGFYCSTMTMLPRTQTSWEKLLSQQQVEEMELDDDEQGATPQQQVLITHQSGAMSLITNLSDSQGMIAADSYRTMSALQTYLTSTLPHALGLSPKAHREVEVDMSVGGRAMLDGNVLRRWTELGSWKRAEGISRIGSEGEWEVKALLEGISGRGLGYF